MDLLTIAILSAFIEKDEPGVAQKYHVLIRLIALKTGSYDLETLAAIDQKHVGDSKLYELNKLIESYFSRQRHSDIDLAASEVIKTVLNSSRGKAIIRLIYSRGPIAIKSRDTSPYAVSAYNDLVEFIRISAAGYIKASESVSSPLLRSVLAKYSLQRSEFVSALEQHAQQYGITIKGSDTFAGSLAGADAVDAVHRNWIKIKSDITSWNDYTILLECKTDESTVLKAYEQTLKVANLPAAAKSVIVQQYTKVIGAQNKVVHLTEMSQYSGLKDDTDKLSNELEYAEIADSDSGHQPALDGDMEGIGNLDSYHNAVINPPLDISEITMLLLDNSGSTSTRGYEVIPGEADIKKIADEPDTAEPVDTLGPEEKRQLLVQTQEEVSVGEEFALTVQVAVAVTPTRPSEGTAPIPVGFAGQLQIEIMTPRGVEAITSRSQPLYVPALGDSTLIRFGLRARIAGLFPITVNAWNGAAHIASVRVTVSVEQSTTSTPTFPTDTGVAQAPVDLRSPDPGEYTLEIDYDNTDKTYSYRLRRENEIQKPLTSQPLISTREDILGGLNTMMNNLARKKRDYTNSQARIWLEGMGAQMFRQLIPDQLQKILWKARNSMKRLNLIAPSDQMPWEMLFLMNPDPEPGSDESGIFLTDTTLVVRWVYGNGAPASIRRAPAYVVIPENSPPGAQQELAAVELVCGPPSLVSDLNSLGELTRKGTFRWLHFAAHNITLPDQVGTSYIPFGKSAFSMEFMASIPVQRYAVDQPLVFMNACTTAGRQPLFTEMGGWADTFLQRGAGAFVGSLWEIRDKSATVFAGAFYQALKDGKNLGEAMNLARASLDSGDPTYLAYTLYGNPNATVQ